MGAADERTPRLCLEAPASDPRRRDGSQTSTLPRTKRLNRLRIQADKLYKKAFGRRKAANHGEAANRWRVVANELRTLEESFVLYQGQEIEATLVNYLSGTIPTSTVDAGGDEQLFRDEAGRYYLRRTLSLLADHHEDGGEGNIPASGRTLVHRLNLNAAILWATTRLNSEPLDLRNDAASLLMENRGYRAPAPTAPMRHVPVLLAANGHDELSPASSYGVNQTTLEAATRYAATAGRTLEQMVAEFLETTAENIASHDDARQPDTLPEPPADVQIVGVCHRFTSDYPATRKACGRQRVLELDDERMRRVSELAAVFGLAPTKFLRRLAHYNNLPGQMRSPTDRLHGALQASHVAFACMDPVMAKRIERAAVARNQTVDEFVADSLGGDVDMWEECMLLHPVSGELLEADYEQLYTETSDKLTTPPVGCQGCRPSDNRRPR